jgi:hypothetical protein
VKHLTAALILLSATSALAQQPKPREPEPPISDPAPASPIDRPKSSAADKPEVQVIEEPSPPIPPRQPGKWWLGWTLGTGYGWHGKQDLEAVQDKQVGAAFGMGAIGHFGPEVGYQYSDKLAFTLQTRHQVIPEVGYQYSDKLAFTLQTRHQVIPRKIADPTVQGSSKKWGHTVLAKAMYRVPRERYQLYYGGAIGGGSGFRFRIDPQQSEGLPASDTVRGGPAVFGPVGGIVLPLADRLSVVGEMRVLVGAPDLAAIADFNAGLQFDL